MGPVTFAFGLLGALSLAVTGLHWQGGPGRREPFLMAALLFFCWGVTAFWVDLYEPPGSLLLAPPLDLMCGLAAALVWRKDHRGWSFSLATVFLISTGAHTVFFASPHPSRQAYWVYQLALNGLSAASVLTVMFPGIQDGIRARRRLFHRSRRRAASSRAAGQARSLPESRP